MNRKLMLNVSREIRYSRSGNSTSTNTLRNISRSLAMALSLLLLTEGRSEEPPFVSTMPVTTKPDTLGGQILLEKIRNDLATVRMPTAKEIEEGEPIPPRDEWIKDQKRLIQSLITKLNDDLYSERKIATDALRKLLEECLQIENPIDSQITAPFDTAVEDRKKGTISFDLSMILIRENEHIKNASQIDSVRFYPGKYSLKALLQEIHGKTGNKLLSIESPKDGGSEQMILPGHNDCVKVVKNYLDRKKLVLVITSSDEGVLVRQTDVPHGKNVFYQRMPRSILYLTDVPNESKGVISMEFCQKE